MHADTRKLLWDEQQAAERIARFASGKHFAEYDADEYLRSAIERQFEIIGEALNKISRVDTDVADRIPDLPRIVAFRNIRIHGYATVDNRLVWGVSETNLGPLRAALDKLLGQP